MTHLQRLCLLLAAVALASGVGGCFNTDQPSGANIQGSGSGVLNLSTVEWGRLVDVLDANGLLVESDVLVRPEIIPDGINYDLSTNPVTEEENLHILQPKGSAGFNLLLEDARSGLEKVEAKGTDSPPPFDLVPRNAAVRLTFTEQVAPNTVNSNSIQVLAGDPATQTVNVRYVVQNDAKAGEGVIILDPTISARQSSQLGLPQNAVGFPESFDSVNDNLLIRIPTTIDTVFGQSDVLMNKNKTKFFSEVEGEPTEESVGGDPVVVRAYRTGNQNDPFQGFLQDLTRPNLLAVQDVVVSDVAAGPSEDERDLTYGITADNCEELSPKSGDVIEVGADVLLVTAVLSSADPDNLMVRGSVLEGDFAVTSADQTGRLTTRYLDADQVLQACFLEMAPEPGTLPALDLDQFTTITARFDEPMDVRSVQSMHSFVLSAVDQSGEAQTTVFEPGTESVGDSIDRLRGYHNPADSIDDNEEWGGRIYFGDITVGNGNRTFTLNPVAGWSVPDSATSYTDQIYTVSMRDGTDGVTDLAGNPVSFTGFVAGVPGMADPGTEIRVDDSQLELRDKYFALRGNGHDANGDGSPEYGGQYDTTVEVGKITGRAPSRFSQQADTQNQYIGARVVVPQASAPFEPLTPAGAVVMTLLRPHDLDFGYLDPTEFNIDVEGLSWSPVGGVVLDDTFDRFSVALSHANQHPDELLTIPQTGYYPLSGLRSGGEPFDDNILGFPTHDEKVVFDTSYTLRAVNLFIADSGSTMLPWPGFDENYTWRDTQIPQSFTGGTGGIGVPPIIYLGAVGLGGPIWAPGEMPSVGAPLLIRYRCYPRGTFLGTNLFQCTQMIPASTQPAFRIYSAGGRDAAGLWHQVIPDNAESGGTAPVGGFDVTTGQPTTNHDSFVYWTQADFVVNVSRAYTHWFAMGTALSDGDLLGLVLEPDNAIQDQGTEVVVEVRGSTTVERSTSPDTQPSPLDTTLSGIFDDYGDFVDPGNGSTVGNPGEWLDSADIEVLEEATPAYEYFQFRFTFVSDADQGQQAFLDGLGFAWDFPEN